MTSVVVSPTPTQDAKTEAESKEIEEDFSVLEEETAEPRPDEFVMVKSKVAPVLLPVHKGLMPHHHIPRMNYNGAPPGLPPPVQSPLPHQTYLEVTLPQSYPFHPRDTRTKNTIASNALIFLLEYIWTHDPTAMIARFPSNTNDKMAALPIGASTSRNREFPNTMQTVCHYLNSCRFHASGAATRARVYLMHTIELSKLVTDLNRNGGYTFSPSPIQAADLASTVWLLGSTEHTNCKDLTKALLNTPEFQARPEVGILLRQRWVKLYLQERLSEFQQVFAIHVTTARHHYSFVREMLQKLYNNNNSQQQELSEFPCRFPAYGKYYAVSDVTSYMLTTKDVPRDKVVEHRKHQKQVHRQCTFTSKDMKGLVPFGGSPLLQSQLLEAMESSDDISKVLHVDRHPLYAFTYTFSWHQKMTPLAMEAIEKIVKQLEEEAAAAAIAARQSEDSPETTKEEEEANAIATEPKVMSSDTQPLMIPSIVLRQRKTS